LIQSVESSKPHFRRQPVTSQQARDDFFRQISAESIHNVVPKRALIPDTGRPKRRREDVLKPAPRNAVNYFIVSRGQFEDMKLVIHEDLHALHHGEGNFVLCYYAN
jgi:hypothetical protein